MATYRIRVVQTVHYYFDQEAEDAQSALFAARELVRSGDWPDDNNEVVSDAVEHGDSLTYDPAGNPDGRCPYDGCGADLTLVEEGYSRSWSTRFRDGQIIASCDGTSDFSDGGTGEYLECWKCGRRVDVPWGDPDLIVWD